METIFAQATAAGRAGVSIVRISGPAALSAAGALIGDVPPPRRAVLKDVTHPDGGLIDQALVLTFHAPASFTGEDVVEFHLHGSLAVVRTVLGVLSELDGCRHALPGEFTRRAMENERLDLAQVEGLADLIDAETEAQRQQAVRVLSGHLGVRVEAWRGSLIRAAALIEATIDFADEDVPVDVTPEVNDLLSEVTKGIQREIEGSFVSERIRADFEVAIVGAPNVGKSTLLNALAGRDAAITSEIAGTTRDVIEVRMDIGGFAVSLLDTAGLRETDDQIEAIGVRRALERAAAADLRVFLGEPDEALPVAAGAEDIRVRPKADLLEDPTGAVSGVSGQGIGALIDEIQAVLETRTKTAGIATRERHWVAMRSAERYLLEAQEILMRGPDFYDIAAEELRAAVRALEVLVGRIDVENVLDEIFASFCLGK